MAEKHGNWSDWGKRLRAHVRETDGVTWAGIAKDLDQSESGIRHWCNGTREINLVDFFRLCAAAKADPAQILFGGIKLTDEHRKILSEAVITVLESDPAVLPHYAPLIRNITKDRRRKP